jgi:hypothetical protein
MIDDDITVRASSLSGYPDCPRRWAARHIRGRLAMYGYTVRSLPNSVGAAIGSGTHAACGNDLQHKIDTGDLPAFSVSEALGMHELETRITEEGVMWDAVSPTLSDAQLQVRRLARTYRVQVAERIKPISVERRLKARHKTGLILSGQQDVTVADPSTLRDIKTGKTRGSNYGQYGSYTLLLKSHGRPVERAIEDFIPRVAMSKPQPDILSVVYDVETCEQHADSVLRRLDRDIRAFDETGDPGVFVANPSSMLCSDRFCPAHGTDFCRLGRKT